MPLSEARSDTRPRFHVPVRAGGCEQRVRRMRGGGGLSGRGGAAARWGAWGAGREGGPVRLDKRWRGGGQLGADRQPVTGLANCLPVVGAEVVLLERHGL